MLQIYTMNKLITNIAKEIDEAPIATRAGGALLSALGIGGLHYLWSTVSKVPQYAPWQGSSFPDLALQYMALSLQGGVHDMLGALSRVIELPDQWSQLQECLRRTGEAFSFMPSIGAGLIGTSAVLGMSHLTHPSNLDAKTLDQ